MSPTLKEATGLPVGFPRVSGDEPLEDLSGAESAMFSPRERG